MDKQKQQSRLDHLEANISIMAKLAFLRLKDDGK